MLSNLFHFSYKNFSPFKYYTIVFFPYKTTQFARENPIHEVLPKVGVKDIEDVTEDVVTKTLRRAVTFHSTLQCHDGHWPGDYGGPMFLMPGLVSYVFNTSSYLSNLLFCATLPIFWKTLSHFLQHLLFFFHSR